MLCFLYFRYSQDLQFPCSAPSPLSCTLCPSACKKIVFQVAKNAPAWYFNNVYNCVNTGEKKKCKKTNPDLPAWHCSNRMSIITRSRRKKPLWRPSKTSMRTGIISLHLTVRNTPLSAHLSYWNFVNSLYHLLSLMWLFGLAFTGMTVLPETTFNFISKCFFIKFNAISSKS